MLSCMVNCQMVSQSQCAILDHAYPKLVRVPIALQAHTVCHIYRTPSSPIVVIFNKNENHLARVSILVPQGQILNVFLCFLATHLSSWLKQLFRSTAHVKGFVLPALFCYILDTHHNQAQYISYFKPVQCLSF